MLLFDVEVQGDFCAIVFEAPWIRTGELFVNINGLSAFPLDSFAFCKFLVVSEEFLHRLMHTSTCVICD